MMKRFLSKGNYPALIGTAIALAYFAYFVLPGLHGRFNDDDPYNIYWFWSRGGPALVRGLICFFSTYYRPMGGVYFFSLYEIFGLNPLPYHIVITILLLINVILVYCCATLLSNSRTIGWICAILMSYHANMAALVYLPAFIYDVLCFTFFFSSLYYYLHIRCAGARLNFRQTLLFLLLYIGALDSKEMAVTLPIMILAYEAFQHHGDWQWSKIMDWTRREALPGLSAGLLTAIYVVGKTFGQDALSNHPAYHPKITVDRFFESNVRFFADIAYLNRQSWFNAAWLIAVWAILAYVAYRRKESHLKWAVLFTMAAPLPIAFIPGRGEAMLYIPCFGWALIAATLISAICIFLSRIQIIKGMRPQLSQALFLLLAVGLIWRQTDSNNNNLAKRVEISGGTFWAVKGQLEAILPQVPPSTKIAFYNDIFEGWDTVFITELLYHDRSVKTKLNAKTPLSRSQLSEMDYVFAYDNKKPMLIKRPGEVFVPPREILKSEDVHIRANAANIRAGKDYLSLQTGNLEARAIDILYTLNGRDMPPSLKWKLKGNSTIPLFVGATTPKGIYHLYAIRDSDNVNLNQWISVDLDIVVR
jgi:hypothetical protein